MAVAQQKPGMMYALNAGAGIAGLAGLIDPTTGKPYQVTNTPAPGAPAAAPTQSTPGETSNNLMVPTSDTGYDLAGQPTGQVDENGQYITNNPMGAYGADPTAFGNLLTAAGYTSPTPDAGAGGEAGSTGSGNTSLALQNWLQQNGYAIGVKNTEDGAYTNIFDIASGKEVGGSKDVYAAPDTGDNIFGVAMLGAAGFGVGAALGAGAGAVDAGAAASDAGGGSIATSAGSGGSGLAGTDFPAYAAYNGPGAAGYQVAGDVAVAPGSAGAGAAGVGTVDAGTVGTAGAGATGTGGFAASGLGGASGDVLATGVGAPGTSIATTASGASTIGASGEVMGSGAGAAAGDASTGVLGSGLSVSQLGQIGSSLYGLYQGSQIKKSAAASDPFAPYRAGYAQKLQTLMNNPSSITNDPGYAASQAAAEQALTRNLASQGLTGSGTAAQALATEGAQFENSYYQQTISTLANLGGANINNAGIALAGQAAGDNTMNQSINNLMKLWQSGSSASGSGGSGWLTSLFTG